METSLSLPALPPSSPPLAYSRTTFWGGRCREEAGATSGPLESPSGDGYPLGFLLHVPHTRAHLSQRVGASRKPWELGMLLPSARLTPGAPVRDSVYCLRCSKVLSRLHVIGEAVCIHAHAAVCTCANADGWMDGSAHLRVPVCLSRTECPLHSSAGPLVYVDQHMCACICLWTFVTCLKT